MQTEGTKYETTGVNQDGSTTCTFQQFYKGVDYDELD